MLPRLFASTSRIGGLVVLLSLACSDDTTQPAPAAPSADLEASVSGISTAVVGAEVTYTVRVSNLGPDAAEQVVVQLTLSGPLEIVSVSDDGESAGDVITWPTLASLADESQVEYSVVVRPTAEGAITSQVAASAETADPVAANNDGSAGTATVTTQASFRADLQVAFDLPATADGGDTVLVTFTTTNRGPSQAADVVVMDSLPAAVEVVSVSDGGTRSNDAVTWPATNLATDDSLVYQVTLVVPMVGPIQSIHLAEAATSDPATGNNRGVRRLVVTATPIRTIQGQIVGENFGWEVEEIGDVNGDAAADLAVSAPFGNGNGSGSGRIYIHSGGDGSLIRQFDGAAGEWLGIDMDAGTDFSGDGIPELIVGAPTANGVNAPGSVYVFSLADGSTIQKLNGENPGDRFGWSAAGAGDVNNDGMQDLYVGARDNDVAGPNSGRAYVYSGTDWSLLLTVDGPSAGDQFGQAGSGVGDLDNDGFDDFAVGAPDYSTSSSPGRGRVYVFSGATGQELFSPIEPDGTAMNFGIFWIFSPGDMNGDGVPDIFASDINNGALGESTGRAYVFSGVDGSEVLTLTGEAAGDQYGIGHPAGDLDGDGVTDLCIAAWLNSEGGNQAGKVYLISGATGEAFRTITSTTPGENFGFDAFVIGDLNGDGIPDLAVSGGISGSTTGHVKLYAGVAP